MFRQNCLLREHALGRFGPMLQAISRDGAMLVWLDSNSNVKGKPNENYARELMELFSLGVGNYTEKDVREAARAFTGWRTDGIGFAFNPAIHDDGPKTVLGKTGNWDGGDVVRIVLEQPAAARFLVRKLYRFFVSETANRARRRCSSRLCESFRKSDYDIAALVRTILSSRHFYSCHAFRQRIKGPVEFVLGAVQAVYRRYAEDEPDYRPLPQQMLVGELGALGQIAFRSSQRQGLAGRQGVAEHGDAARACQLRSNRWRWARSGRPGRRSQAQAPRAGAFDLRCEVVSAITSVDRPGRACPKSRLLRARSTPRGSWRRRACEPARGRGASAAGPLPARRRPRRRRVRSSWRSSARARRQGEPRSPGARGRSCDSVAGGISIVLTFRLYNYHGDFSCSTVGSF